MLEPLTTYKETEAEEPVLFTILHPVIRVAVVIVFRFTGVAPTEADLIFPKFAILLLYYTFYASPKIRASKAAYSIPVTVVSSIPESINEISPVDART